MLSDMGMMINRRRVMGGKQTPLDYNDSLIYRITDLNVDKTDKAINTGIYPIQNGWYPFTMLIAVDIQQQPNTGWDSYGQNHIGGAEDVSQYPYPGIGFSVSPTTDYSTSIFALGKNLLIARTFLDDNGQFHRERVYVNSHGKNIDNVSPSSAAYKTFLTQKVNNRAALCVSRVSDGRYFKGYFWEFAFFGRKISDEELEWWINNNKDGIIPDV